MNNERGTELIKKNYKFKIELESEPQIRMHIFCSHCTENKLWSQFHRIGMNHPILVHPKESRGKYISQLGNYATLQIYA